MPEVRPLVRPCPSSCRHHERGCYRPRPSKRLGERAIAALVVAAVGAGGANDNHSPALAAVLESRHLDGIGSSGGSGSVVSVVYD